MGRGGENDTLTFTAYLASEQLKQDGSQAPPIARCRLLADPAHLYRQRGGERGEERGIQLIHKSTSAVIYVKIKQEAIIII